MPHAAAGGGRNQCAVQQPLHRVAVCQLSRVFVRHEPLAHKIRVRRAEEKLAARLQVAS